jgi:hypothetical protein
LGIAGMKFVKALKTVDGAGIIQQIEVFEGVLDQGIEVERVGMGSPKAPRAQEGCAYEQYNQ